MFPKIDTHSIKFKTWLYFVVFAATLMLALWITQVFLLNSFYATMKTSQTQDVASEISASFKNNTNENFFIDVDRISSSYDMYIFVVSRDGKTTYFSPTSNDYAMSNVDWSSKQNHAFAEQKQYEDRIKILNSELAKNSGAAEMKFVTDSDSQEILGYASILRAPKKANMVVYIFSPLWPVSSTIKILKDQLIIVTIISLILACAISLYLSLRITRPIRKIERSAKRLAAGEYGIIFKGGHYTELINLTDTLTRASIELEKTDMIQKDLVANVSHDLRTPLTLIKSYAEMIRDLSGNNPEKREEHLQVIIDESDRLNNLVEDLLVVSRLQSGKMTLEKSTFNLSSTIESIVGTYKVREDEGYHINFNCEHSFTVFADEEKIKQVIANLMSNALKFCGEDKTVTVKLSKRGRFVRCSISDNGRGIASDELEHIWDRYYKASSNTIRDSEGSGLGLSICKEILTLHKTEFGVVSTVGKGTTFWFELEQKRNSN